MIWIYALFLAGMAYWSYTRATKDWGAHVDAMGRPLDEPEVTGLVARMADAMEIAAIPVTVLERPDLNGGAMHDGRIFITQGFLNHHKLGKISAEEIASVVAHEVGHVALGHPLAHRTRGPMIAAVNGVLVMTVGRFVPFIGPYIAGQISRAIGTGLSRKNEFEADAYATSLMLKAGLDPRAQKSLFEKLPVLSGEQPGQRPSEWLSTHPAPENRIKAIDANLARWG